ncbi:MAG: 2-C-methyl-D-erythritol 2,4-cyclodiphosphate synthase [Actinomycetota bacterium]
MAIPRVGQGFDVHPWSDDDERVLVLGGVRFEGQRGLRGHSDADVIAHACTDALLGATGLGDIGSFYPDTDPAHEGADSIVLLADAVAAVRAAGWSVVNLDCTVICDAPKIAPHREAMQHNLSTAVGAPVSIKGKTTEGLVSLSEGIQCLATAMVVADG